MKIIEFASEDEVLMQENIPLAHALYDEVDIGNYIPPVFYEEIATIYTWIYEVQNLARP